MYVTDQKSNAAGSGHWLDIHDWRRCPCLKHQRRRILGPKPNPDSREKKPESILDLSPESIIQSSPLRFLNRGRFGSSINLDSIPKYNAIRFPIQAQANRARTQIRSMNRSIPGERVPATLLRIPWAELSIMYNSLIVYVKYYSQCMSVPWQMSWRLKLKYTIQIYSWYI
jgi:hypothetical protein